MPLSVSRLTLAALLVVFAAVAFQRHQNNSNEFVDSPKVFDRESSSMMNIGMILTGATGHCNPGTSLGQALQERGHHVTIISTPNAQVYAERTGLDFIPIGTSKQEQEIIASGFEEIARSSSRGAFQHAVKFAWELDRMLLRDVPGVLQHPSASTNKSFDFLIIDEMLLSCVSVAQAHNIQSGLISTGIPQIPDAIAPPTFTSWQPTFAFTGAVRNLFAWLKLGVLGRSNLFQINEYRRKQGLGTMSPRLKGEAPSFWLSQLPSCLDFPYRRLPGNFVHTVPWHNSTRRTATSDSFPWEKLDGRPILYVSLGTVQNQVEERYLMLAEACMDLDVQLVMTLGRRGATLEGSDTTTFPKGAIVVDYAPQVQLLERATALVTHAGMNTALEALSYGLPMLALPVNTDQPGVAARLAFAGAAEVVRPDETASSAVLREALERILIDPRYRQAAEKLRDEIRRGPTLEQVAELVEIGFSKGLSDDEAFNVRPEVVRIVGEPPPQASFSSRSTRQALLVVFIAVAVAWVMYRARHRGSRPSQGKVVQH